MMRGRENKGGMGLALGEAAGGQQQGGDKRETNQEWGRRGEREEGKGERWIGRGVNKYNSTRDQDKASCLSK